jgi:hypothetical protein
MTTFQSTVSTVAALASIFAAGAAGWKLAQNTQPPMPAEEMVEELRQKVAELEARKEPPAIFDSPPQAPKLPVLMEPPPGPPPIESTSETD